MSEEKKAKQFLYPLPYFVSFTKETTHEQAAEYWVIYNAQRKHFAENGNDESSEQVKKFWESYTPF